jgi:hypothetical protein
MYGMEKCWRTGHDQLCENVMIEGLKLEKVAVTAKSRKMDFGKIVVCSDCGSALMSRPMPYCCEGKVEHLRDYYERVYNKPFNADDWSFDFGEDMTSVHGIDVDAEMVDILGKELLMEEIVRNQDYPINSVNNEDETRRTVEASEEHPQADAETD